MIIDHPCPEKLQSESGTIRLHVQGYWPSRSLFVGATKAASELRRIRLVDPLSRSGEPRRKVAHRSATDETWVMHPVVVLCGVMIPSLRVCGSHHLRHPPSHPELSHASPVLLLLLVGEPHLRRPSATRHPTEDALMIRYERVSVLVFPKGGGRPTRGTSSDGHTGEPYAEAGSLVRLARRRRSSKNIITIRSPHSTFSRRLALKDSLVTVISCRGNHLCNMLPIFFNERDDWLGSAVLSEHRN